MLKTIFFVIILLYSAQVFAQELLYQVGSEKERLSVQKHFEHLEKKLLDDKETIKCLTSDAFSYQRNHSIISPTRKNKLDAALIPEIREVQATYLSENGWFVIEYDTTGTHALLEKDEDGNGINDLVEKAAQYAEESWRLQVETWGFRDPLIAGNPYRISFQRLSSRFYGVTYVLGSTSYIVINPRLDIVIEGSPNTDPEDQVLGALKVTVAHELKHAIQIVYGNQARQRSFAWWEMDATLMEELVYDEVNDYYNYLTASSSLFRNPQRGLATLGSYFHSSFALFFVEYYGIDFWVSVWEKIGNGSGFNDAILAEIEQRGDDPAIITTLLYEWHYLSGDRAKEGVGFEEAEFYPTQSIAFSTNTSQTSFTQPVASPWQARSLPVFSAYMYEIFPNLPQDEPLNLSLYGNGASMGVSILSTSTEIPIAERLSVPRVDTLMFLTTDRQYPLNEKITVISVSADASLMKSAQMSTLVQPQNLEPTLRYGDGNIDGIVDDRDYEDLLGYALSIEDRPFFPPLIHLPFDVSGDGTISAYDAALLLDATHSSAILPRDNDQDTFFPEIDWFDQGSLPKIQASGMNEPIEFSISPENSEMDAMISLKAEDLGGNSLRSGIVNIYYNQDSLVFIDARWKSQPGETIMSMQRVQHEVRQGYVRVAFASSDNIELNSFLECMFNQRADLDVQKTQFIVEAIQLNEFKLDRFPTDTLITTLPTGVGVSKEPIPKPTSFVLESNYPNPFNPSTTIAFNLPTRGSVELSVFSIQGQKVATLTQGTFPAGRHEVRWDASRFASGMYVYEWVVSTPEGEFRQSKKMLYLK